MARSSNNPMQEHHRKARLKEIQKNKQKRIKERDEVVLNTKSITEVREEIKIAEREMKRHGNNPQQRGSSERKIARLQKEQKILQEAADAAKAQAAANPESAMDMMQRQQELEAQQKQKRPLSELDDPRKSVYYDEQLNPYGAPPPGKPRLYHRRWGGVTLNPHEAVTLEQQYVPVPPPPPPPPPPRQLRHHHNHYNSREGQYQNTNHPHQYGYQQQHKQSKTFATDNEIKKDEIEIKKIKDNDDDNKNENNNKDDESTIVDVGKVTTSIEKKTSIPSLPAPSQAVQRTARTNKKKGGILADIWASTEEVEYERETNRIDLEADDVGTSMKKAKKKKKKTKVKKGPLELYYRDTAGTVQGPFTKYLMKEWSEAGYFPPTTLTRTNRMKNQEEWIPIKDLPALKDLLQLETSRSKAKKLATNKSKSGDDDVQARIAALKQACPNEKDSDRNDNDENYGDTDDAVIDCSMEDRIAALRADILNSKKEPMQQHNNDNDNNGDFARNIDRLNHGNEDDNDDVQNRIANLRNNNKNSAEGKSLNAASSLPPPPLPRSSTEFLNERTSTNNDLVGPTYPIDNDNFEGAAVAAYPYDDNDDNGMYLSYPTVAYPVDDDDDNDDENENNAATLYPTISDYPYPTDEAYPVTESYPADNSNSIDDDVNHEQYYRPSDVSIPLSSIHHSGDNSNNNTVDNGRKKVVKVDKELVSFVPSNLTKNKKRKADRIQPTENNKVEISPSVSESVGMESTTKVDDYDRFMKEIDEL